MPIQITSTIATSKFIQYFKGGASKIVREEFPEFDEFLWNNSFVINSDFREAFESTYEEMIQRYSEE